MKAGVGEKRARTSYLLLLFCLGHIVFAFHWIHSRLGTFYYYRGDDVIRIGLARIWNGAIEPRGDWLPFPEYILGALLALRPDPYGLPLYWHCLLAGICLGLVGFIAREMVPEEPAAWLLAAAIVCRIPYFELISFSAGAEVELWFFLLAAAYAWILYRRRGAVRWAALSGAALFFASGIRYESWIFIGALLFIVSLEVGGQTNRKRLPAALLLLPLIYIAFFIYFQERDFHGITRESFNGLPLSWRGIRLYFRGPSPGVRRSFLTPLTAWFMPNPLLSLLETGSVALLWFQRKTWRWYIAWLGLAFVGMTLVSEVFGTSDDPGRLFVSFHLFLAPVTAGLLMMPLANIRPAWRLGLAAAAAVLLAAGASYPRIEDGIFWTTMEQREAYAAARSIHETEEATGLRPVLLVEAHVGQEGDLWFYIPLEFAAFERLAFDRRFEITPSGLLLGRANPSLLDLPEARLAQSFKENGIGWIVARSPAAKAKLGKVAHWLGDAGSLSVFAFGLPTAAELCRLKLEKWRAILAEPTS